VSASTDGNSSNLRNTSTMSGTTGKSANRGYACAPSISVIVSLSGWRARGLRVAICGRLTPRWRV
jgi:hypothetical protein